MNLFLAEEQVWRCFLKRKQWYVVFSVSTFVTGLENGRTIAQQMELCIDAHNCTAVTKIVGSFSNRTGTSFDDGALKSNIWFDQWLSDKLDTGSLV